MPLQPPQGPPIEIDAGFVGAAGLRALLDVPNFGAPHRYHGQVFPVVRLQEDGVLPQRIHSARFQVDTGNLAAALYEGNIHVRPAGGNGAGPPATVRLLRVQAWVENTADAGNRWKMNRTLDDARLVIGQSIQDDALEVTGSANGVNAAGPSENFGIESGDELLRVAASAARLSVDFAAPMFLRGQRGADPATMPSFLTFAWDRTAALNDNDTAIVVVHYVAAPAGVFPPR